MKFSSQTLRTFTTLHTWVGLVAGFAQGLRCPLQVDGVPQHDGRRHQVEAAAR